GVLGHDDVAVDEDRDLAHRVQVDDRALLLRTGHDVDEAELVGRAYLLERPQRGGSAGEWMMVERDRHRAQHRPCRWPRRRSHLSGACVNRYPLSGVRPDLGHMSGIRTICSSITAESGGREPAGFLLHRGEWLAPGSWMVLSRSSCARGSNDASSPSKLDP